LLLLARMTASCVAQDARSCADIRGCVFRAAPPLHAIKSVAADPNAGRPCLPVKHRGDRRRWPIVVRKHHAHSTNNRCSLKYGA
jgi:hypothetical protein